LTGDGYVADVTIGTRRERVTVSGAARSVVLLSTIVQDARPMTATDKAGTRPTEGPVNEGSRPVAYLTIL